jgi:hypothetical protein
MSVNYTITTNFGAKDALPSGDSDKVIRGTEFTTEFTSIQTAFTLCGTAAAVTSLEGRADDLEAATSIAYATDTAQGVIELATLAEVDTGTDNTRAITPLTLSTSALAGSVATNTGNISTNTGNIATLNARNLVAGNGLTGGGTLDADRTFNVVAGSGISVTADAVAFDTTWGDARYLQSFTEVDTLATVTARGATSSTACTFQSDVTVNGTLNVRTAIDLADNDILRFGTGDDCELFCNGSHMYMDLNAGIGNFYIRDGSTTRFTFDDAGAFTATGNITAYSDIRLKKNITKIEGAIEKVQTLAGYTYQRTDIVGDYAGVVAQEVQEVLPEAIKKHTDGTLSVDYNAVTALMLQAVNELIEEVRGSN